MNRPEPNVPGAQQRARTLRRTRPGGPEPDRFAEPGSHREITYAGLATRTIAFALDAAIINGAAAMVGIAVGLGVSIMHLSEQVETALGVALGILYATWSVVYFIFFWATSGQTPGNRVMRIRVLDGRHLNPVRPVRGVIRFGALLLAALPLLAGFLIMLWDDRRRCLQDRIAHTVVIEEEPPEPPAIGARNGRRPMREE